MPAGTHTPDCSGASTCACADYHVESTKGHCRAAGEGSWQAELTPHKLSHTSIWGYLMQGLTLLGNLCGLSAVIKEVSAAINQVSCPCIQNILLPAFYTLHVELCSNFSNALTQARQVCLYCPQSLLQKFISHLHFSGPASMTLQG